MEIISRKDAEALGMMTYFTGHPCKRGHVGPRYTRGRRCVECANGILAQQFRLRNPEAGRIATQLYRERNADHAAEISREWVRNNRAIVNASNKRYAESNPDKMRAKWKARRLMKLSASVDFDAELTEFVTREAASLAELRRQATGIEWHIDHMIPLRARTVCGLHVWNNLQVIPGAMNLAKRNTLTMTQPGEWVRNV